MNSSCQSFAKGTDNPEEKVRKFGEYRPGTGFLEAGVYWLHIRGLTDQE